MEWTSFQNELREALTSETFGTLAAGAFGALFGGWGAHIAISRSERKKALKAELNSINAALALCFFISNTFCSLKRQHVLPMWIAYTQTRREHGEFLEARKKHAGTDAPVFEMQADLETINPVKVSHSVLERQVFEEISMRGRGLAAMAELINSIDALERLIFERNQLISEFRETVAGDPAALAVVYLGIKQNGFQDERYSSTIEGIKTFTDCCIFYSYLLSCDLTEYGKRLRRWHFLSLFSRLPKIASADWTNAKNANLIPSNEEFRRWLNGFKRKETLFDRVKKRLGIRVNGES